MTTMIEQWALIVTLASGVMVPLTSYDSETDCRAMLKLTQITPPVQASCMKMQIRVGRPKHRKRK
jgi:hypothetical protein